MNARLIQLSKRGKSIYQLLSLTVILLLLYALGFMLTALGALSPTILAEAPAEAALQAFTAYSFDLLVFTGLVGAGIMQAGDALHESAVQRWRRIWTGFVAVVLLASPIAPPAILDSALALFLLLTLLWIGRGGARSTYLRVWQWGMFLSLGSLLAARLADGLAADVARAFQTHVGFALSALSLLFWLMTRFSRVDEGWARAGARIVAVLVFLGGSLISLGRAGLPVAVSLGAAPLLLLCYCVLASHSYRALSKRNENASLAPHWIALAALLWLFSAGFFGVLSIQPAIAEAMRGSDLAAAGAWLADWTVLAVILAFTNEAASSLLGGNQRVTGYVPFWLISFGLALSGIAQICRGVAEIYLRQVSGLEPAVAADLLMPITTVWIFCLAAVAVGCAIYALGFWLRRPTIRVRAG